MSSLHQQYRIQNATDEAHRQNDFTGLNQYWNDPEYRQQLARTKTAAEKHMNLEFDRRQIEADRRWPSHWTDEEKREATRRLLEARQ